MTATEDPNETYKHIKIIYRVYFVLALVLVLIGTLATLVAIILKKVNIYLLFFVVLGFILFVFLKLTIPYLKRHSRHQATGYKVPIYRDLLYWNLMKSKKIYSWIFALLILCLLSLMIFHDNFHITDWRYLFCAIVYGYVIADLVVCSFILKFLQKREKHHELIQRN
ncbi:hypothetical protein [Fructilactobacillus carniphilus]|uniref:Uncharacterized protein n=1 Tax=Fructilactobacillus carniphilus TaxID=2940297 RepID=A0ABY5BVW6_9LACO|nr:hypothetical protein [Fructilactobacillus carniphilus]USS90371.1 hypothetical protein M3M37_05890 [Fructilactobacillus carniphilus]